MNAAVFFVCPGKDGTSVPVLLVEVLVEELLHRVVDLQLLEVVIEHVLIAVGIREILVEFLESVDVHADPGVVFQVLVCENDGAVDGS